MPVRCGRLSRLGAVGVCGLTLGLAWMGGPSLAQSGCSSYSAYSALAAAAGVRTVHSAPGLLLIDVADGSLPEAQAQADSLSGSRGWAGAPYSSTAAGNVGATGAANANDVPVFALSSYPAEPEASKSTPVATIEAKSGPRSSTASVVGGGRDSDQASVGRVATSAAASCRDDATVQAVAQSIVEMVDFKGVLRIASVRSHAQAAANPAGQPTLEGTMAVEGATVLGQPVAITDRGVVTGGSTTPAPDNPLARALAEAGISVRYVAAVKDAARGQVFAAGLEVVVTRGVQGVGTGPPTSTYTLGRAYARAATSRPDEASAVETGLIRETPASEPPLHGAASGGATSESTLAALSSPAPQASAGGPLVYGGSEEATASASRIANASSAGVFGAMGAGALLFVAAWLVFERLGAKLRWR